MYALKLWLKTSFNKWTNVEGVVILNSRGTREGQGKEEETRVERGQGIRENGSGRVVLIYLFITSFFGFIYFLISIIIYFIIIRILELK